MSTETFKGARYIPKFYGNWTADIGYEAIGVVKHNAFTYISKQPVPAGVEIDNTDFWLLWADPNAQMEELRQIFMQYVGTVNDLSGTVNDLSGTVNDLAQDLAAEIEARKLDVEKAHVFETVADMKQGANLSAGAICHTNGFYTSGDGGAAWYSISETGTQNDMDVIELDNGLFANLIFTNTVYANQIGLKNDNETDNTPRLEAFIRKHKSITVYFDRGVYRFSPLTVNCYSGDTDDGSVSFIGVKKGFVAVRTTDDYEPRSNEIITQSASNSTIFAPIGNQTHILKFNLLTYNVNLSNIIFTSISNANENNDSSQTFIISDALLYLYGSCHGNFDSINFEVAIGTPIKIDNCWECTLTNSNFRWITVPGNPTEHGCIEFNGTASARVNCSAWHFDNLNFESVVCNWFYFDAVRVQNITCTGIIGECGPIKMNRNANAPVVTYNSYDYDETPLFDVNHTLAAFASRNCSSVFAVTCDDIAIDNFGHHGYVVNNVEFGFVAVTATYANTKLNIAIGIVQVSSIYRNTYLYSGSSEATGAEKIVKISSFIYSYRQRDVVLKYMRGSLTSCEFPNLPSMVDNITTFHNNIQDLLQWEPREAYTTHRFWFGTDSNDAYIRKLCPTSIDADDIKTQIVAMAPVAGHKKITVITNTNTDIELKQSLLDGTLVGTATETSGSQYKVYELEVQEGTSIAAVGDFLVLATGHTYDYIYAIYLS